MCLLYVCYKCGMFVCFVCSFLVLYVSTRYMRMPCMCRVCVVYGFCVLCLWCISGVDVLHMWCILVWYIRECCLYVMCVRYLFV